MSIRLIAMELYECIKEVERLEKMIAETPYHRQAKLRDDLRKAKADRDRMRKCLDGGKDR